MMQLGPLIEPILRIGMIRLRYLLCCSAMLWLAACGSKIHGVVYLDGNGTGVREVDELVVSGVAVKAYDEENVLVGSSTTDGKGIYQLATGGPGNYCLVVDSASMDTVASNTQLPVTKAVDVMKDLIGSEPATPPTAPPPAGPTTAGGTVRVTPPPGSFCADVEALSVELNLPVKRDYAAAVSQFPPPTTFTYTAGEEFVLKAADAGQDRR
ncbi:MAG: hypothetical protein HYV03_05560 [Deltaproteobacteria bacterium]|nr:hypothetical protein [Deltaproteobacteria bacterium]